MDNDKKQCPVCDEYRSGARRLCRLCGIRFGAVTITKQDAEIAVKGVVNLARSDYKWGGDEDEHGTLQPGYPDFDRLQQSLLNIVQMIEGKENCNGNDLSMRGVP